MPMIVEGLQGVPALKQSLGAWVKENTIAIAERELRLEVGRGFDARPVVITDGVPRRDYHTVKPFGRIEFARRANMADAVLWALDQLRRRSPVLTGRYVSTHTVLINGQQVTGDVRAALLNVGPVDRVQIVNPQPYARKIEGATASKRTGRKKRAAISRQARSGVYRVIHRAILQRYGRTLFADFKYVKLEGGIKVWGDQGGGYRKDGSRRSVKRVQRDQVYPAISFFIKADGPLN